MSPVTPGFVELPPEDADEDGDEDDAEEAEYDDDGTDIAPSHCSITPSWGQTSDSSPSRSFLLRLGFLQFNVDFMLYDCVVPEDSQPWGECQ